MSEKLCEKCQEVWDGAFWGRTLRVNPPGYLHCHHEKLEEKPKEKCWCELPLPQRYGKMTDADHDRDWFFKFCGACGRRMWGI